MTSFRIRTFGTADWVQLDISGDDEELEEEIVELLAAELINFEGPYHIQQLTEDGEWENVS